jgi:hypothetical protein
MWSLSVDSALEGVQGYLYPFRAKSGRTPEILVGCMRTVGTFPFN